MKSIFKLLFLSTALTLLFTQCESSTQPELICDDCVDIPDRNFLKALIEEGVDKNGDGAISFAEAEEVNDLRIAEAPIEDVTGIEAFIHLETFSIYGTNITSLDLSNNTALTKLNCFSNQLLTSPDLSNSTALTKLNCSDNHLVNLDVSNCTALICLDCSRNQLSTLDISENTSLGSSDSCICVSGYIRIYLAINNMSSLRVVCVWTWPLPIPINSIRTMGSPNVYFTTECSN